MTENTNHWLIIFVVFLTSTDKQADKVQKAETGSTDNDVNSKGILEKWG